MDRVRLLRRHIRTVIRITKTDGGWVDGEYIEGQETRENIRGVYLPFSTKDFLAYPQGFIEAEDLDLKTKANVKLGDLIEIEGETYKVMNEHGTYIADLKSYVLRRFGNDS